MKTPEEILIENKILVDRLRQEEPTLLISIYKSMELYARQFKTTINFKLDKEQIEGIVREVHGRNCPNCGCQL